MTAKSDKEREIFLEMARSWKKAAIQSAADPRSAAGGSLGMRSRHDLPADRNKNGGADQGCAT
jgi:hypothetical protein